MGTSVVIEAWRVARGGGVGTRMTCVFARVGLMSVRSVIFFLSFFPVLNLKTCKYRWGVACACACGASMYWRWGLGQVCGFPGRCRRGEGTGRVMACATAFLPRLGVGFGSLGRTGLPHRCAATCCVSIHIWHMAPAGIQRFIIPAHRTENHILN